ncbi:MAG: hypothetical protein ABL867_05945 [Rickettsiales bacterium]
MTPKTINRFPPHPLVSCVFSLFIVLYWQAADIFLRHHDIGWHVAAGQQIRNLMAIPKYDRWSFTAGDTVWLNISWLWDVAVSKIYEIGGFAPLVWATIILGALLCATLARICLSLGISTLLVLFGVILVGLIFPFYQPPWDYVLSIAPQAISLLFFLIFYAWILDLSVGKYSKKLFLLPLLMVLWVNLHGAFILGFMLIGGAFLTSLITNKFVAAKYCVFLGIACAVAVTINPLGIHIIDAVMRSMNGAGNASITEWQPFEISINLASAYLLLFVMMVQWRRADIPVFCRIIVFICLVAGLLQKRNFVYFLFTSLPVLLMSIEPWLLRFKRVSERIADIEKDMAKSRIAVFAALFAGFILCAASTPWAMQKRFPQGVSLPEEFYPEEEIAYLRSRLTGETLEPIFNNWNFGGHLIFSLRDKVKVYIDGRADTAYPASLISMPLQEQYKNLEKNTPIRFAIMPNYQPISQIYFKQNPHWKQVFSGKVATIFERKM